MLFRSKLKHEHTKIESDIVNLASEIILETPHIEDMIAFEDFGIRGHATQAFDNLLSLDTDLDQGNIKALQILDRLRFLKSCHDKERKECGYTFTHGLEEKFVAAQTKMFKDLLLQHGKARLNSKPELIDTVEIGFINSCQHYLSVSKEEDQSTFRIESFSFDEHFYSRLSKKLEETFDVKLEMYIDWIKVTDYIRSRNPEQKSFWEAISEYRKHIQNGNSWNSKSIPCQCYEHDMGLCDMYKLDICALSLSDTEHFIKLAMETKIEIEKERAAYQ